MGPKKDDFGEEDLPGNYDASEDVFRKGLIDPEVDPEDITRKKVRNARADQWNEKSFEEDPTGEDLDIPGAELDDKWEGVGSEDEENNYYSLGGDNHNDLEENQG